MRQSTVKKNTVKGLARSKKLQLFFWTERCSLQEKKYCERFSSFQKTASVFLGRTLQSTVKCFYCERFSSFQETAIFFGAERCSQSTVKRNYCERFSSFQETVPFFCDRTLQSTAKKITVKGLARSKILCHFFVTERCSLQ